MQPTLLQRLERMLSGAGKLVVPENTPNTSPPQSTLDGTVQNLPQEKNTERMARLVRQYIDREENRQIQRSRGDMAGAAESRGVVSSGEIVISNPARLIAESPGDEQMVVVATKPTASELNPQSVESAARQQTEDEINLHPEADKFLGREFVEAFLEEVAYLIKMKEALEGEIQKQNDQATLLEKKNQVISSLQGSSEALLESIRATMQDASRLKSEEFDEKLKLVFSEYKNFLNALGAVSAQVAEEGSNNIKRFQTEIEQRRKEVDGVERKIGGGENFERIRFAIRAMENLARRFASKTLQEINLGKTVVQTLLGVKKYAADDLAGLKAVLSSGSVVDIVIATIMHGTTSQSLNK